MKKKTYEKIPRKNSQYDFAQVLKTNSQKYIHNKITQNTFTTKKKITPEVPKQKTHHHKQKKKIRKNKNEILLICYINTARNNILKHLIIIR